MASSVCVCVYCQSVCYRWLCQYVCVCVRVRACVRARVCTVSLSAVYGFCQYVCMCAVSVCAAVGVVRQYLCVMSEGREPLTP